MRFAAIAKCLHQWPLAWLCKTLEVTRGGFYAWAKRPECERSRVDTQLTAAIRTSFAESDQTYGSPRVFKELKLGRGMKIGEKRVARLMRRAGLVSIYAPKRLSTLVQWNPVCFGGVDLPTWDARCCAGRGKPVRVAGVVIGGRHEQPAGVLDARCGDPSQDRVLSCAFGGCDRVLDDIAGAGVQ